MLSRRLLRVKVMQMVFANNQRNDASYESIDKELQNSVSKSHELYHLMMLLPVALKRLALKRIENGKNKIRPTQEELNPNLKFVENRFIKEIENTALNRIGQNVEFDLSQYFYDEDGEQLKYTASSSAANVVHPYLEGNRLLLTSLGYGMVDVTVTGTDAAGKSCSSTFKALVRDDSRPVDVYPNPVSDNLFVRPGGAQSLDIEIINKAGAAVYSKTVTATPFEPCSLDVSNLSGGSYTVHITGSNLDVKYSIVKL